MNAPRRQRVSLAVAAFIGSLGLGLGCSRAHLTSSHGRAYHEAFAAQDATPENKPPRSVHGLDSQEAAIIAGNYRKALSPKAEANAGSGQLLMVNPQRPVGDSAGLPSSVPSGQ